MNTEHMVKIELMMSRDRHGGWWTLVVQNGVVNVDDGPYARQEDAKARLDALAEYVESDPLVIKAGPGLT